MNGRTQRLGFLLLALTVVPFIAGVAAQDKGAKEEARDGIQNILEGLFSATQAKAQGLSDKGDELKERLTNRVDGAKSAVQGAIQGAGSAISTTADIVADTTKLVADILTEDLRNTDIKGSLTEAGASIRETINTLNGLVVKFATILQRAAPSVPSWETIKNPKNWPLSLMSYTGEISKAMSELVQETGLVYEGISAKYCEDAKVTPPGKVPGEYTGYGFNLKLSSGKCWLEKEEVDDEKKKKLTCEIPSVTWEKTPIKYVSKHHTPLSFTSKSCKVEKTFGTPREEVLFELEGDFNLGDALQQAAGKIGETLESLSGENDKIPDQFRKFITDIESQKETAETVSKFDEGTIDATLSMIDGIISYSNGGALETLQNIPTIGGWQVNQKQA
ncbi:hypothetical protein M9434_000354 [Picochlorum sp. BPE23]|nr:hypothetical protein M9434_000354 [Picochlorum sp. BPE23]